MDKETNNPSLFSLPEGIQDYTIMNTPLPQAASTALKSTKNISTIDQSKRNKHCNNVLEMLGPSYTVATNQINLDLEKKLKKEFNPCEKDDINQLSKSISLQTEKNRKNDTSFPSSPNESSNANCRFSILSSADSSFGILPSNTLKDVQEKPLAEFSEQDKCDLSQRLAKELQLDSSYFESLADDSKNINEDPVLKCGFVGHSNPNASLNSNPFSDCSKLSIDSEMFNSDENVAERLQRDEDEWRGQLDRESLRSLSGIYDVVGELPIGMQGERLSFSSFLRSGSGPLGCLESVEINQQRPNFGLLVSSPEKKSKPHPIKPPPEDKPTFIIDEEKTCSKLSRNDNPWNPQSLIEQYSLIHGRNHPDVSVPSISYIGDMLSDNQANLNPREMFDKLMASSRKSSQTFDNNDVYKNQPENTLDSSWELDKLHKISSMTEGKDSFCIGFQLDHSGRHNYSKESSFYLDNEPSKELSKEDLKILERCGNSTTKENSVHSFCNVTGFDGEEEEYVCILSPVSMDFEIVNNCANTEYYYITKSCFRNNTRDESAALIHIPLNNITLQPNEKKIVPVVVAALVDGTIKIKLEVARKDLTAKEVEVNTVYGKIIAERPKISLICPTALNVNLVNGFGDETIDVKNCGLSSVPLKLIISQINFVDMNIFYFNEEKYKTISEVIKPGQIIKQRVCCQAPPIYEICQRAGVQIPLLAQVDILLETATKSQLPPLLSVSIQSQLELCTSGDIKVSADSLTACLFYNSSNQMLKIQASTTADYYVQTPHFTIPPMQTKQVLVGYSGKFNKKGTMTLYDIEYSILCTLDLYSSIRCTSTNSSLITPQSSRATSPISPFNIGVYGDSLKVTCTHKELVWGGCPLQQRVMRTCILKNEGSRREKLRLTIRDDHNCFKILNDRQNLENEIKLSLQPMQSCQISVALLAGSCGPKWGQLIISRINAHLDKKVIPLYGFGGKAKISIEGILQDPEQHMWLYLDSETLTSSFTLMNKGDNAAFVKITDGMSATSVGGGLSIAPPEGIVQAGHSILVEINLSVTADRLEYLLAKPSQSAICITRLAVIHGDESTRLRLSRLSLVDHLVANKLSTLNNHLPLSTIPQIEKLNDPTGCGETLWLDDVTEWTIGVLVRRSSLEALRLDTSCDFVELSNTVYFKCTYQKNYSLITFLL